MSHAASFQPQRQTAAGTGSGSRRDHHSTSQRLTATIAHDGGPPIVINPLPNLSAAQATNAASGNIPRGSNRQAEMSRQLQQGHGQSIVADRGSSSAKPAAAAGSGAAAGVGAMVAVDSSQSAAAQQHADMEKENNIMMQPMDDELPVLPPVLPRCFIVLKRIALYLATLAGTGCYTALAVGLWQDNVTSTAATVIIGFQGVAIAANCILSWQYKAAVDEYDTAAALAANPELVFRHRHPVHQQQQQAAAGGGGATNGDAAGAQQQSGDQAQQSRGRTGAGQQQQQQSCGVIVQQNPAHANANAGQGTAAAGAAAFQQQQAQQVQQPYALDLEWDLSDQGVPARDSGECRGFKRICGRQPTGVESCARVSA